MRILHDEYIVLPGAREDALGRWMPVVSVHSLPMPYGSYWCWDPKTIVSERHKTRREAERRSVAIAKQMIDHGDFKSHQAIHRVVKAARPS
jgi:hypothetical protein